LDNGKGSFDIIIQQNDHKQTCKLILEGTKIRISSSTQHIKTLSNISNNNNNNDQNLQDLNLEDCHSQEENSVHATNSSNYAADNNNNNVDNSHDHNINNNDINTHNKDEIKENNNNDNNNVKKEPITDEHILIQGSRVEPDWIIILSRENSCEFNIIQEKSCKNILTAQISTPRDRDILAIVIRALIESRFNKKQAKKKESRSYFTRN